MWKIYKEKKSPYSLRRGIFFSIPNVNTQKCEVNSLNFRNREIEKYKTLLMKAPRSLHFRILEFIWYYQGRKFWKRTFTVKFKRARFSLKQIFRSSERFHLVNNWFNFNAGNLFFSVFFFFFSKNNIYRTEVAFKRIFDKTCIQVFLKSIIFLSQQFTQTKTFQNETSIFFSVPLKIIGGWLFLLFKKFNQNEKINVNLDFHPSYRSLEKFYGRRKSIH